MRAGGHLSAATTIAALALIAATGSAGASTTALCPQAYATLTNRLTVMEGALQVGINHAQYDSYITKVRIAYDQVPWSRTSLSCLTSVGLPAEDAMNDFILAGNDWGSCINRIYASTASDCTSAGDPGYGSEQVYWTRATAAIQRAVNAIG